MQLTSARLGEDAPAHWVHTCSCPPGYEGQFCERCSAGFTRSSPADGAFSRCRPCDCSGGSCDTVTGDCYSADQTGREPSCPRGFYRDPWLSRTCSRCPCPEGVPCSVEAGSATPRCERCPSGTTGGRLHHEFVSSPSVGGARIRSNPLLLSEVFPKIFKKKKSSSFKKCRSCWWGMSMNFVGSCQEIIF